MAIRPVNQLAPNVTGVTASYPDGSSKDETAPGNNDGTPYKLIRADDIFGFQQALTKMAGIVASGNADTALDKNSSQYLQAILHAVLSANTFDESGAADAYVLDVVGNNPAPANYSSNMNVNFIPGNTNTGASTANVEGLGVKSIRLNGVALVGGELVAGVRTTMIYDSVNGWFELVFETGKVVQSVNIQTGAVSTGSTIMPFDDTIPQNTEGDELMTLAITPKATTNILKIQVIAFLATDAAQPITAGLFQDATINALAAITDKSLSDDPVIIAFNHYMLAGTVAATTFKLRAGKGVAGTTTFNGTGGVRKLGGVMASSITITEEQP